MTEFLSMFSGWFRPHLTFISSAFIATILVVYGDRLNKAIWQLIKGAHFIVRTLVFVLICALGYGAISVYLVPVVSKLLLFAGTLWLGPVVVVVFTIVGVLAERKSR